MGLYLCFHPPSHVALRFGHDHSVFFSNQEPTRNVLPKGAPDWNSDAAQRNRPLHGREHSTLLCGSILRESRREGSFGKPNQTVTVGHEFWRLGMRFEAIEDVCDLLALVGS